MHRLLSALLCIVPAFAQITSLAINDKGGQLYISTTFQLAGTTGENNYQKLFSYDGTSFHLFAQRSLADSSDYHLVGAYVSGNGSVIGYTAVGDCLADCDYRLLPSVTTLFYPGSISPSTLPYPCGISKNAQYALCAMGGDVVAPVSLINMATGASIQFKTVCLGVSSNGIALQVPIFNGDVAPINVESASGLQQTPLGSLPCPMISDDGSTIVSPNEALNLASGKRTTFYTPSAVGSSLAGISNDGSLVLEIIYKHPQQFALIRTDGSLYKELTSDPSGVQPVVAFSGDGAIAYVVTGDGQLLKIATATGATTQLVGRTPWIRGSLGAFTPGSQVLLYGSGLSEVARIATEPVTTLGGSQVLLNGQPAPMISAAGTQVAIQIPWEMPSGDVTIQLAGSTSQFVQPPVYRTVQAIAPALMSGPFHQDFSALVQAGSPAHAGEIVQYYFTGLGPVTPAVADGLPGPANPLSVLANPLTLVSDPAQPPSRIFYQGLAPGLVGIYQVSIELPATINSVHPVFGAVNINLTLQYDGDRTLSLPSILAAPTN